VKILKLKNNLFQYFNIGIKEIKKLHYKMQCKGITKAGTQCTRQGEEYCFQHSTKEEIKEEVKNETTLIDDLEYLSHEYLDPYTYVKLIATDPKLFNLKTYQKILANHEKIFPLIQFEATYTAAIKMIEKIKRYILNGKKKINPIYVTSLILEQISKYGEDFESITDSNIVGVISNTVEETIKEHIKLINTDYRELIGNFKDDKLVDILDDMGIKLRDLIFQAFEILKATDPEVFDTDHPFSYRDKLEPILKTLV